MKKTPLIAAAAFALAIAAVYPLEVNREELSSSETSNVEFINYTGPHETINSIQEIRSIGSMLGLEIRPLPADRPAQVGNDRYRIIHAVDPSSTNGFDADILILGDSAGVDHITNLRRIVSGYLSSAYGYPERDADTLAFYITVYNAVHRGDMDFFESKYKNVVTRELSADSAGLALSYTEWPGKTQLVIPLSDPMFSGTLSTIDTSSLIEDDVIESIRADESAPAGIRSDMTDLIEREGDEAETRAEQARSEAAEARSEAEQAREEAESLEREAEEARRESEAARREAARLAREAEEAQRAAETARQDAEEAALLAAAMPDDSDAARAAREAAEAAEASEQEAERLAAERDTARETARESAAEAEERAREAEALREQQEEAERRAAEAEERASREQELADSRLEIADQERLEIAAERQEELDRAAAARREAAERQEEIASADESQDERGRDAARRDVAAADTGADANSTAVLRVADADNLLSEIILVNTENGLVLKTSQLNSIRNRTLIDTGDAYMVIAGRGSTARLTLVDKETLDVIKESALAVAAESMLAADGNDYYVVVSMNGAFYLGRFDKDLNVLSTSSAQVQPYSVITVSDGQVFVQDSSSRMRVLRATDLVDVASADSEMRLNRS